ncbi:hypothetical protein AC1031_001043 [Aphanomyces cochlioides]|nr:hypothetical protein AC1031_001043 [Aphanomyces cochlioides]
MTDVKFLAVLRVADKNILSSYSHTKVTAEERKKFLEIAEKVVSAPSWHKEVGANSRHALEFETLKLHFMIDSGSFVFFAVTNAAYPLRVAHLMINELQAQFTVTFAAAATKDTSLDCSKMMKAIATKYEDVTKVDKLAHVQHQVEVVKDTMKDSINIALSNTEKIDTLSEKANHLADTASIFHKGATDLRRQMWWKNFKVTLAIALAVILAILVLLASLGVFNKSSNESKSLRFRR